MEADRERELPVQPQKEAWHAPVVQRLDTADAEQHHCEDCGS